MIFFKGKSVLPTAIDDATSPARVIKNFLKENEECLDVVGVFFEGEVFDPSKYVELGKSSIKRRVDF